MFFLSLAWLRAGRIMEQEKRVVSRMPTLGSLNPKSHPSGIPSHFLCNAWWKRTVKGVRRGKTEDKVPQWWSHQQSLNVPCLNFKLRESRACHAIYTNNRGPTQNRCLKVYFTKQRKQLKFCHTQASKANGSELFGQLLLPFNLSPQSSLNHTPDKIHLPLLSSERI